MKSKIFIFVLITIISLVTIFFFINSNNDIEAIAKKPNDSPSNRENFSETTPTETNVSINPIRNENINTESLKRSEINGISETDIINHSVLSNKVKWIPDMTALDVKAGGRVTPVYFEEKLTNRIRNAIVSDLNIIYGHLDSVEFLEARGLPKANYNGKLTSPEKIIMFTGKGRYFPKSHLDLLGPMIEGNLIINKKLSDIYINLINFRVNNIEKFKMLESKIEQLNTGKLGGNFDSSEWFVISSEAAKSGMDLSHINKEQFESSFMSHRYRKISLDDVYDANSLDPTLKGELAARIYFFDKNGILKKSMPHLVFSNGKWKFFISHSPT